MTKEIVIKKEKTGEKSNFKKIKNRFGEFEINLDKKIFFMSGLLGMPGYRNFCLTEIPNAEKHGFKLLQSVDDEESAFVTLPFMISKDDKHPLIDKQDIDAVAKELEVSNDNLVILLIANFTVEDDKTEVYVNTRAPIIIDAAKQAGLQYVFQNDKYEVRLKISE